MATDLMKQLLGSANVTESPYGTPADGPAADGANGAPPAGVDTTPVEPVETPVVESPYGPIPPIEEKPEAEPTPEKPVETPKPEDSRDAAFRALAKEKNETRRQLRQLQAEMATLKAAQNKPPVEEPVPVPVQPIVFSEPDPVEAYIAQNGGDPNQALPWPEQQKHDAWFARKIGAEQAERERQAAVKHSEQDAQRRKQEDSTAQAARDATYSQAFEEQASGPLSAEKIGDGLGLDDVSELANAYLTTEDKQLVRAAGEKHGPTQMWKTYYAVCVKRLEGSGTPEEATLRERAKVALAQRKPPSPAGPSTTTTPAPSKTKVAPTRAQILQPNKRGVAILRRMGFPTPA